MAMKTLKHTKNAKNSTYVSDIYYNFFSTDFASGLFEFDPLLSVPCFLLSNPYSHEFIKW